MSPPQGVAPAHRYRTRHSAPGALTSIPEGNLLWRDPKVPRRREEAAVQLELLAPEEMAGGPPPPLPDPERLALERIDRTIHDTLAGFRPQLTRVVREIRMYLQAGQIRYPDQQAVEDSLAALEDQLQRVVRDELALKTWSALPPDA